MKAAQNKQQTVNPAYDYQDTFDYNEIAVVGKGGKFGYIDREGIEFVPPKYDRAMRFYGGLGRIQLNGKWGLVNREGREITPPIYDEIFGHQDPVVKLDGKYGFVSAKTGELLTPVKYDMAEEWVQLWRDYDLHANDLAKVQLGGKWGCIDIHGNETVPLKYDNIKIAQHSPWFPAQQSDKWGFVDRNGKELAPFEYDDVTMFFFHRARVKKDGKYGFIDDSSGEIVIPLIYDDCETQFQSADFNSMMDFLRGIGDGKLLPVLIEYNGKYGFLDVNGNEVAPPVYDNTLSFHIGCELAAVVLDGKAGFIDRTGHTVIACRYEVDFSNPENYVFLDRCANVKLNGKWGAIDRDEQVIIPVIYDNFIENRYACWRHAVRDGRKVGIDTRCNEWDMRKNPDARTFRDYLQTVTWEEVAESFRRLNLLPGKTEEPALPGMTMTEEQALMIYELDFNNFKTKQPAPSQDIIRIHTAYYEHRTAIDAELYSVRNECAYTFFDWAEILDMEIRVEDNLVFTDAEAIAICIWRACDCYPMTEEHILT
jgi:hypothetical protein